MLYRLWFLSLLMFFVLSGFNCGTNPKEQPDDLTVNRKEKKEEASKAGTAFKLANAPAPMFQQSGYEPPPPKFNTEEYSKIDENPFKDAKQNPMSTFSIDVDKASYGNVRRYLNNSELPPEDAVRIEELINYFSYDYPQPKGAHPFSINIEFAECPWNEENRLLHIGIQGKKLDYENLKPCNLVFLVDASGSMSDENKLPLLKKALKMMVENLSIKDRVAIVAYAGAAGLVLPSTPATEKENIIESLERLSAGGSTAGGEGIELAYTVARQNLIADGNNRVILCTDGDFNIGVSSSSELIRMIEEKRKEDIYLTICGFGMGNYKDSRMEEISNAGNGNYFYIDNIREAQKVFVREMRANLFTIAKDVKIQIEFNPALIKAYRLIGYENRLLANEDFNDDTKDAGELGAGHSVTAIYEIVPAGATQSINQADSLKYQTTKLNDAAQSSGEIATLKFRYKPLKSDISQLIEQVVKNSPQKLDKTSENFRFSVSVAGFGMMLRDSPNKKNLNWEQVEKLAKGSLGSDTDGDRNEFIKLVETAKLLSK